jgi:hypothetical protein
MEIDKQDTPTSTAKKPNVFQDTQRPLMVFI